MTEKGPDGTICNEAHDLKKIVMDSYTDLFSSNGAINMHVVIDTIQSRVSTTMNTFLC